MIRKLTPPALLVLSACNFTTVSWEEGTWVVAELLESESSPDDYQCDVFSVFEDLEPMTYVFGPTQGVDANGPSYDSGHDGYDVMLTEKETEVGLSNLWAICNGGPSTRAEIYCDHAPELLYADKWLPQVKEILKERRCGDAEAVLSSTSASGGLISPKEAFLNSRFNFTCANSVPACSLRLTSRLRPVD